MKYKQPILRVIASFVLGFGLAALFIACFTNVVASANLVSNAGAEDESSLGSGVPAHWLTETWSNDASFVWDRTFAHSGQKSLRIANTAANDARWVQDIDVISGHHYRLSGWIKTAQIADSAQSINAGANLSLMGEWTRTAAVTGTHGWVPVAVEFVASSSQVRVAARIGFYSGTTMGTAWFDDIELQDITPDSSTPTPTSTAVLPPTVSVNLPVVMRPAMCAGVVSGPSWKFLALIYMKTDFSFVDAQGVSRHLVAQLSTAERDLFVRQLTRFTDKDVPALTECGMQPTLTVRIIDKPLTHITEEGCNHSYAPTPQDVSSEFDRAFDSLFVLWDGSGVDTNSNQALSVEGCAYAFPGGTAQTYSVIGSNFNGTADRNVYKHEWGHSISFYFDAAGTAPKPAVNNHINDTDTRYVNCLTGQPYILKDETDANPIPNSIYNNESSFTHDYYSGHTATADQPRRCLGITRSAWLTGGPVSRPKGLVTSQEAISLLDVAPNAMIP